MKKLQLLFSGLLVMTAPLVQAQFPAWLPETPLPASPIYWAVHSGASTLQQIPDMTLGGAPHNFYAHCWDEGDQYGDSDAGIAWRVTDAGGSLVFEGNMPFIGYDLDLALFVTPTNEIKLLVAYFRGASGSLAAPGYYYDIYKIVGGMLVPDVVNVMIDSPTWYCGGINVDASSVPGAGGLAITWGNGGSNTIKLMAAPLTGVFGMPMTIAPLNGYRDPDVSIGSWGGNRTIYVAALKSTSGSNNIQVYSTPLPLAITGTLSLTTEGAFPSANSLGAPRIDCPEQFGAKKWAAVFEELLPASGGILERVRGLIKNTTFVPGALPVTIRSYYTSGSYNYIAMQPVVAYYAGATKLQVGWMSRHAEVASGTVGNNGRYLGETVLDPNSMPPSVEPESYYYIDDIASGSAHTLSFSGQELHSAPTGLYVAFSQIISGGSHIVYKSKPWMLTGFRPGAGEEAGPGVLPAALRVYPNPFRDALHVPIATEGMYEVSLYSVDGRRVYHTRAHYNAGSEATLATDGLGKGVYLLHLTSDKGADLKTSLVK